ncbi:hypothetical protein [Methylobacterium haplocladii]|uniref:Uncharacterized protein n=1 Tax=Methylobacterium haplocladii TaxID=1176176 RepID=A0A512IKM2_9HYPH|nr:hypothetical protein [Methylobacterium haplocladii]GEO98234.1 hypothetical protein MHA02_06220 [Methylobacterium haplocladii]GJD84371.1 hypothetical protein HPGCJGGD_2247 [Methylobacterium haplocladii]GLS59982.1 hypothetical protein GCM10007887_26580 [Methylobacterium haplocladii]
MKIAVVATAVAVLAASPFAARAESCQAEIGRREAARLVERCLEVSPATRPPCNAANACSLIESEIVRGCRITAEDAPRWCQEY